MTPFVALPFLAVVAPFSLGSLSPLRVWRLDCQTSRHFPSQTNISSGGLSLSVELLGPYCKLLGMLAIVGALSLALSLDALVLEEIEASFLPNVDIVVLLLSGDALIVAFFLSGKPGVWLLFLPLGC